MKKREPRGWFESGPKKPPPEHGIKMKKAGATWWGQRWIEALQQLLRADAGRLSRGRTYARAGRTHDLTIKAGKVTAKVTGSRSDPYQISIELPQLSAEAWQRAIANMADKAQFSAELLGGHMPQAIDEAFRAAGASLFPAQRADLKTDCSCPDWGDPCKHIAAAYYVIGEALDGDPFLLFELRGKTKEEVLSALRAARGLQPGAAASDASADAAASDTNGDAAAADIPSVKFGKLQPADYDKARQALPSLHCSFDQPVAHAAVLRQLGTPSAWSGSESPAEVLSPLLRAAAETARRIAMAETQPGSATVDDSASVATGARIETAEPSAPAAERQARPSLTRRGRSAAAEPEPRTPRTRRGDSAATKPAAKRRRRP